MDTTARLHVDQRVAADIDEFGISVMGIFPGADDDPGSSFNYTVGLTELGQPEVIVAGLNLRVGHYICNEIHRRIKEDGLRLTPGLRMKGLVNGDYEAIVCRVTDEHEANMARSFYVQPEFVQVLLPDMEGAFPWDPAYNLSPLVQKDWWIKPQEAHERDSTQ